MAPSLQLAIAVAGVYVTFLSWGILQERVSTTPYQDPMDPTAPPRYFKQFIFLNLCQACAAAVVAWLYLRLQGISIGNPTVSLMGSFFGVAFLNSIASPFGYASLQYIDYPTMILGKSCKLVPVMVMSYILYRKKFSPSKYLAVALITLGVSLFMFMDPHKKSKEGGHGTSKTDNSEERTLLTGLYGLFLLTMNLAIDGITNSTQDRIFHAYKINGQQMMLFMNVCSAILMSTYLLLSNPFTGELSSALEFCSAHPRIWIDIGLFSVCGALGQVFIFYTLQNFGSLVLVTVTVTRKMLSIILSVVWFGHVLSLGQWVAVGIVFFGIGLEDLMKLRGNFGAKKAKAKNEDGAAGGNGHLNGMALTENGRGGRRRVASENLENGDKEM